nr:hypothetical protein [Clostridium sartagoforme]
MRSITAFLISTLPHPQVVISVPVSNISRVYIFDLLIKLFKSLYSVITGPQITSASYLFKHS